MKQIVHLKSHLGKEPVILVVKRGIDDIRAHICADSQRQEISRFGVDVEIC
jgi:hypothetical protein